MSAGSKKPNDERKPAEDEFGTASAPGTFRIERMLPGPIERVWAYLTEPEKRRKWLAAGEMELKAAGRVKLRFRFADLSGETRPPGRDQECEIDGRITRCEPPRLLSYTWDNEPDASEVSFELTPRGKDVLLVVTHRRLSDRGKMVSVASGWNTHLGILTDHLDGREPRAFWSTKFRMEAEYEKRLPT